MLSSVEQAFVGREEIRAPLKTPAWEASCDGVLGTDNDEQSLNNSASVLSLAARSVLF